MKKRILSDCSTRYVKNAFSSLLMIALGSPFALAADVLPVPDAPKIDAAAYILMDAKSGQILAAHDADNKHDPASLTKMMTSYVVGEAIKQHRIAKTDIVPISHLAWVLGNPTLKGSSLMFLKPGDKVTVRDLNHGIIIQSGNDASIAMAEYIAGSQESFVNMMNDYAKKLGLTNTHFETVHGLDAPSQYTTARDMATLGRALIDDLPQEYRIYKQKYFTYNNIKQTNRNGLLWDQSLHVDGIKTGHTNAAGYNLVASAVDGNTRLISTVLGGRTFKGREEESKKLLTWGFRFFTTVTPVTANTAIANEPIWYGNKNKIALGANQTVNLTVIKGQEKQVNIRYKLNSSPLKAPLKIGQTVGTIQLILNNKILRQTPLVALETVPEAGFFSRIWDSIKLTISQWFN